MTDDPVTNPYLLYSETVAPKRRSSKLRLLKSERDAPMVKSPAEKQVEEQQRLFNRYQKWNSQVRRELIGGPYGQMLLEVTATLRHLQLEDGPKLLEVMNKLNWLAGVDYHVRMFVLGEIDQAVINLRISNGLSPISDALPGEPPTIFQIVKENLIPEERSEQNHDW